MNTGESGVSFRGFGAGLIREKSEAVRRPSLLGERRGYADLKLDPADLKAGRGTGMPFGSASVGSGTACSLLRDGDAGSNEEDCDTSFSFELRCSDDDCDNAVRRRLGRLVILRMGRDSKLPSGKPFPSLRSKSARVSFTPSGSSSASSSTSSPSVGIAPSAGVELSATAGAAALGSSSFCVRTTRAILARREERGAPCCKTIEYGYQYCIYWTATPQRNCLFFAVEAPPA